MATLVTRVSRNVAFSVFAINYNTSSMSKYIYCRYIHINDIIVRYTRVL